MIFPIAPFSEDECGFRPSASEGVLIIQRKIPLSFPLTESGPREGRASL